MLLDKYHAIKLVSSVTPGHIVFKLTNPISEKLRISWHCDHRHASCDLWQNLDILLLYPHRWVWSCFRHQWVRIHFICTHAVQLECWYNAIQYHKNVESVIYIYKLTTNQQPVDRHLLHAWRNKDYIQFAMYMKSFDGQYIFQEGIFNTSIIQLQYVTPSRMC